MKIRTKLFASALLPLGLFLVVGMTFLYTNHEVERVSREEHRANAVRQQVAYLNTVIHYYMLYHEERPRVQLQYIQESIHTLLAAIQPETPREVILLKRLTQNHESEEQILHRLTALWERGAPATKMSKELESGLTGQALERVREMVDDTLKLHGLTDARVAATQKGANRIILISTAVFTIFVSILSFMVMRRVSVAIEKLLRGTRVISEGNLDHRIPFSARDELAGLSAAFNNMTDRLKESYASLKHEISVRQEAEEAAEQYAGRLEIINRELQDFAFVASHDLQEPLRKIQAFGDQLRIMSGEALTAEGLDFLTRMQNAAARMQALIQALLAYSRIATRAQPFTDTDLGTIVHEAVDDLETRIAETEGRIDIGPLPVIKADQTQMRQLFQNLIGNALKFHGPEKPVIKVSSRRVGGGTEHSQGSEGQWEILVEDNGIGFDAKYLDRIFVPFQRLHGRGVYEGTGIGLAICRKIVERHGGIITATSRPLKGSTFIVSLPENQTEKDEATEG